jgi:hypothetical protein
MSLLDLKTDVVKVMAFHLWIMNMIQDITAKFNADPDERMALIISTLKCAMDKHEEIFKEEIETALKLSGGK